MGRDYHPSVVYNEAGDQLEVHWSPVAPVAHWVNSRLTILRSAEDEKEIIGVILTGFRSGFHLCGLRLDKDYDDSPPMSSEEIAEVDRLLAEIFPGRKIEG